MDLYIGALIAALLTAFGCWIAYRKRRMSLFERYGIPGPKPSLWTGNLKEFVEKRELCVPEWTKKYGKFVGFYLGAKPLLIVYDANFLRIMQVKEFHRFTNKDLILPDAGVPYQLSRRFLEMLDDQEWKNARSTLGAALSTGKIKRSFPIVAGCVNTFMRKVKEQGDRPFDIASLFKKLTFDTTSKSFFGIAADAENESTHRFVESVEGTLEADSSQLLVAASLCFPEFEIFLSKLRQGIDTARYLLNKKSILFVIKTCRDIIQSRKNMKDPPVDLLQCMIEASSEHDVPKGQEANGDRNSSSSSTKLHKMSDEEVLANSIGFMAAGFHTTSVTLGYCAYLLSKHPDIQEKVREEIKKHFKPQEEIDYAGLVNLQYMDQVISETTRLYPVAMLTINRVCKEDFKYSGMTIPKGALMVVPVWSLHRDPEYWTEPNKFIPERFSVENRGKIDQFQYQPFGAGPRICIGMRLSTSIMKYTLANFLRNYRIESCDEDKELEVEHHFFHMSAKNGVRVRVTPVEK